MKGLDRVFDFIIVGAGSAGCVLAERLSANGRFSVLVLEAGGSERRFFIEMPLGYGKTFYDPAVNWMYAAEADPGLNGQRDYWPRGKVLGGSSSINAMVYIRGAREDYESWEAAGNAGWGWAEVLRCYRAMEDTESGADELSRRRRAVAYQMRAGGFPSALPEIPAGQQRRGAAAERGFQRGQPGRASAPINTPPGTGGACRRRGLSCGPR